MEFSLDPALKKMPAEDRLVYMDCCVDDILEQLHDFGLNPEDTFAVLERARMELFT